MDTKITIGVALGFVAGFALHALFMSTSTAQIASTAANAALAAQSTTRQQPQCALDWARMRAELDGAVRGALARSARADDGTPDDNARPTQHASAGGAAGAPAQADAAQAEALTAAQAQARQAESRLLDQALQRGKWTVADATAAKHLLPNLSPADLRAMLSKVAVAINSGQLKLEAPRPF